MKFEKQIARKVVFPAMMALGLDKMIRKLDHHTLLHVMYHGVVAKDGTYFSPRHIHKDQFEKHLKYFRDNFDVISIPEAFYRIQNNDKSDRKTITISFDDGYKNNLDVALPLLEKYGMKASFFIPGICVEVMRVRCLWTDLIAALHYFYKEATIEIKGFSFTNLLEKRTGINLYDYLKACPFPERETILEKLTKDYDLADKLESLPEELWKLMTKDELIQMSRSAFTDIGSHGYLHYNLGITELDFAIVELNKSKKMLQDAIHSEVNMIAYPDGSYNADVKEEADKAGYKYQLAVNYLFPGDKDDLRIMNRHGISCTTTFESNMLNLNRAFRTKGF